MLVAFAFIVKTALSFDVNFVILLSPPHIFLILILFFAAMPIVMIGAYCWRKMMSFFSGADLNYKSIFRVYAKSNLGKYLPGNVGHYAGRQFFGASMGLKQSHIAFASVLEVLYNAVSALMLSVIFAWDKIFELAYILFSELNVAILIASAVCVVGVLFVCSSIVFRKNKYFKNLLFLFRTKRFWFLLLKCLFFTALNLLLISSLFIPLVGISVSIGIGDIPFIIAAGTASWLIGFITPGVPGGIGVRETVLVLMLSPVFPKEAVLTAAVLQRFAMIVGDVLAWALGEALVRIGEKKKPAGKNAPKCL
jgi:uncharacterized membrane protein YbhN (UPF0104 family)